MATDKLTLISADQTAKLLGLSPSTLAKWRGGRRGPKFIKLGHRVAYSLADLHQWIDRQTFGGTHPESDVVPVATTDRAVRPAPRLPQGRATTVQA